MPTRSLFLLPDWEHVLKDLAPKLPVWQHWLRSHSNSSRSWIQSDSVNVCMCLCQRRSIWRPSHPLLHVFVSSPFHTTFLHFIRQRRSEVNPHTLLLSFAHKKPATTPTHETHPLALKPLDALACFTLSWVNSIWLGVFVHVGRGWRDLVYPKNLSALPARYTARSVCYVWTDEDMEALVVPRRTQNTKTLCMYVSQEGHPKTLGCVSV